MGVGAGVGGAGGRPLGASAGSDSPEVRTLCVDLDFTICTHRGDYGSAEPIPGAREALTRLREAGWIVVLQTARHFNHWQVTEEWLSHHGIPYDQLVFGKPPARYYVDDRGIAFQGDWRELSERLGSPAQHAPPPGVAPPAERAPAIADQEGDVRLDPPGVSHTAPEWSG